MSSATATLYTRIHILVRLHPTLLVLLQDYYKYGPLGTEADTVAPMNGLAPPRTARKRLPSARESYLMQSQSQG